MILKIICSKSNSITFNRSLEMRNEVETQDQLSQGTSIQQNIMRYLAIAGGLISMILKIIWVAQLSRNTKLTVPRDFNSAIF